MAIWDTGATNSVVTQAVVNACGLKATSRRQVTGVHGKKEVDSFLVNITLNNNQVRFVSVEVTVGELTGGDVLIGMDIISMGDFSVTNFNGLTVCSYRVPSQADVDYVKRHEEKTKEERSKWFRRGKK